MKSLLTQDQIIPGSGNAIAQDVMFKARLHPKRPLASLGKAEIKTLQRRHTEDAGRGDQAGRQARRDRPPWESRKISKNHGQRGRRAPLSGMRNQDRDHEAVYGPPSRWYPPGRAGRIDHGHTNRSTRQPPE